MLTGAITSFPKYEESRTIIGNRIVTPDIIDQNTKRRTFFSLTRISMMIGIEIRPTNGHPSRTDIAVKKIESLYCWCHHAARADIVKYIEKELGKRAAEEMNIPTLKSWKTSHDLPM